LLPENTTEETKEYVYEADSPEEIAAWDFWVAELRRIRPILEDVWYASVVQSRRPALRRPCFGEGGTGRAVTSWVILDYDVGANYPLACPRRA
jgi:hypothetical protein